MLTHNFRLSYVAIAVEHNNCHCNYSVVDKHLMLALQFECNFDNCLDYLVDNVVIEMIVIPLY